MDLDKLLEDVILWAKEAGKIQLSYFRGDNLGATTKSNIADVVTKADKESEAFLIGKILSKFPNHSVLGEETGSHQGNSDYLWVVDPLDGTNNFSQGLPVFCISIGLQYKGETILGLVYAPYLDELYTAIKGKGAYFNLTKKLHVSEKTNINTCVMGTGFPYDKGTNPINNISNLVSILPNLRGIRRMGSAAYDLCCTAAGLLDAYWELSLQHWDMCAGAFIVEEAGGEIFHFRYDRNISIMAANHKLLELMKHYIE